MQSTGTQKYSSVDQYRKSPFPSVLHHSYPICIFFDTLLGAGKKSENKSDIIISLELKSFLFQGSKESTNHYPLILKGLLLVSSHSPNTSFIAPQEKELFLFFSSFPLHSSHSSHCPIIFPLLSPPTSLGLK